MNRLLVCALAAVVGSGCAAVEKFRKDNHIPDPLDELKRPFQPFEQTCGPGKARAVPWAEEHEIGGAVALGLAQKAGGVFIELSPSLEGEGVLDPEKWKEKVAKVPEGDRADMTRYLDRLTRYLAQFSERPTLPWTVAVLDSPTPNAFSAPGGYIFVTTGLLKKTQNEAQLAAVIAHEVGHVTAHDSINAYKEGKYWSCYGVMGLVAAMKQMPSVDPATLAFLPEGVRKALSALSPAERAAVAAEWECGAKDKGYDSNTRSCSSDKFNPGSNSAAFVAFLTDVVVWFVNATGYGKDVEFKADETADRILTYAGYDRTQLQAILMRLPDGGGMSPHPSNKDRKAALDVLQKKDAEFAGKAAPDNAEQLKAAQK